MTHNLTLSDLKIRDNMDTEGKNIRMRFISTQSMSDCFSSDEEGRDHDLDLDLNSSSMSQTTLNTPNGKFWSPKESFETDTENESSSPKPDLGQVKFFYHDKSKTKPANRKRRRRARKKATQKPLPPTSPPQI